MGANEKVDVYTRNRKRSRWNLEVPIELLDTLAGDGEFLLKRCIVTGSESFSVTRRKFLIATLT